MNKKAKISIIISTALIVLLSAILGIYFGFFHKGKHKSIFKMTEEEIQYNYKGKITDCRLSRREIQHPIDVSNYKYLNLNLIIDCGGILIRDWDCFSGWGIHNSNEKYRYKLLAIEIIDYKNKKTVAKLDFDVNNSIFSLNRLIDVSNISTIYFKPTFTDIDWVKYFDVAKKVLKGRSSNLSDEELAKKSIEDQKTRLKQVPKHLYPYDNVITIKGSYAISK